MKHRNTLNGSVVRCRLSIVFMAFVVADFFERGGFGLLCAVCVLCLNGPMRECIPCLSARLDGHYRERGVPSISRFTFDFSPLYHQGRWTEDDGPWSMIHRLLLFAHSLLPTVFFGRAIRNRADVLPHAGLPPGIPRRFIPGSLHLRHPCGIGWNLT